MDSLPPSIHRPRVCVETDPFSRGEEQVEKKVNQRRAGGIGVEAQDRQERREGERIQRGGKERGTGLSKVTEDSGGNIKEHS